jgi:hypothetical protein
MQKSRHSLLTGITKFDSISFQRLATNDREQHKYSLLKYTPISLMNKLLKNYHLAKSAISRFHFKIKIYFALIL